MELRKTLVSWLRGTYVVERWSLTGKLSLRQKLDLQLMGDHLCG